MTSPFDEDLTLAVTRCHAQVSLARFAGSVDHTAHDGHAQRNGQVLEALGHVMSASLYTSTWVPSTGRAGHDFQLARAQTQRLQDSIAHLDLFDRGR